MKYDEKRYLGQFVSEMFDYLQQDSTTGAPQYELKSFVTTLRLSFGSKVVDISADL